MEPRGGGGLRTMLLLLGLTWTQLLITDASSGDGEIYLFPSRHSHHLHRPRGEDALPEARPQHLRHHRRARPAAFARWMPAALLDPGLDQEPIDVGQAALLARPHEQVQPGRSKVSGRHLVTMVLAVDVRRLNISLLLWFREGVAAALGVAAGQVHIHRLNEEKNGIELFVSSARPGLSEPRPAEEVIQALNIRVLHQHLGRWGITEISTEKNVLQDEQRDHVWNLEGFYALVLFFTIFIIITTCLMVLYRLKEKGQLSDTAVKAPRHGQDLSHPGPPDSAQRSKGTKLPPSGSMVQAALPSAVATPTPQQQPITACRHLVPPVTPVSRPVPVLTNGSVAITTNNDLKLCPSPFKMKPAAGLQERRGSNVSLVLDMSALGSVEPMTVAMVTPREAAAREYLLSASRPLTRQQVHDLVTNTHKLQAEFAEIPMNFIDPKELDIPNHGTKNRYKTILPNPHSRVILKSKSLNDPLSSYINANYIRGYRGDERAFIATQGPMVNTVNDFWQMAWQEEAPAIVMITKLKEKNEKCVLYWPEKRGIYGKVEVLVSGLRECEHYSTRSLTLKCGNQTRVLQHYWYTSWPDHKTPDSTLPLLQLMADVEAERRAAAGGGPVVVHCSAGIGRTGCFIATTIGCRQLELEGVVDVLNITCQLRADRGGMIQTGEQYEFVHHALSLYEAAAETGQ